MSKITIYHNPECGTSRNTLAMIRNSGTEPTIIYYLETPPSREELTGLLADMAISARELLRKNVEPYETLGLGPQRAYRLHSYRRSSYHCRHQCREHQYFWCR